MHRDTIFALASGRPPAAIAVVRVSGQRAHQAAIQLAGKLPEARRAVLSPLKDPRDGSILDQALLLRFDGPASATGEDVVEFHIHGGRAVAEALLGALAEFDGFRAAEPGEFTRRAFASGRIDLTEAEGLADLIEAETQTQRRAALALAEGGLRRQLEQWQQQLLGLSARAEAAIDYVDDDDDPGADRALADECLALAQDLGAWLARPRVEPLKDGVRVVLAGPPNAGKSSLLNAMADAERAIVTPVPGTTRDRIDVPLALEGLPIVLTDTAGLRETGDAVERIGVERSQSAIEQADVLLWLGEPDEAPDHPVLIRVHARADLAERSQVPEGSLAVSSLTASGLPQLLARIAERARALVPGEDMLALNRRQAAEIAEARASVEAAGAAVDVVLVAEHLRQARAAFDRLTGKAGMEDVLDALFGRFCLGK